VAPSQAKAHRRLSPEPDYADIRHQLQTHKHLTVQLLWQHILGLVVWQGMILGAIGTGAGIIGPAALTRVMASLLFGVSATDLVTFNAVAAILATVVFAATAIPARRATAVDPMVALREE
jgi:hypothetical protein